MINGNKQIGPGSCIKLQEDVFYIDNGKHKHAGKRTIIGRIKDATSFGFYNIEVLASDGENAYGKGAIIQRPAGNILVAEDCTGWVNGIGNGTQIMKAGGHVEGYSNGKKVIMDNAKSGGIGIGATHKEGGIKGEVGTDGHKIEFENSELILTAPVSEDTTLYEFEGKKSTPRQIASKLNVDNGGVAFTDGGDVHSCKCSGKHYQYGGKTMSDFDIINDINKSHQFAKAIEIENKTHYEILAKLNAGAITIDEAIIQIANSNLKKNPNYYTQNI